MLKIGAVFPLRLGSDPLLIRDFVQAVEASGYDYIQTYEQIVDISPGNDPALWAEPLTLLSYIAALTDKLELATGITVLSSRQTMLAAKQIAQLDRFCGGRLRLGVSSGWHEAEYAVMDVDFAGRGKRLDEQISLLRRLWTERSVTFDGDYHTLKNVGVFPKPKQQPIPIWIGGYADAVLKRAATLGDGWLADVRNETPQTLAPKIDAVRRYSESAGRNPEEVGLEIVDIPLGDQRDWAQWMEVWEEMGIKYMAVTSRFANLGIPQQHFDLYTQFIRAVR